MTEEKKDVYTALDNASSLDASQMSLPNRQSADVEEQEQVQQEEVKNQPPFCTRLFGTYNKSFLFALGMQYSNTGMRQMLVLAMQNLYDNKYKLDQNKAALYISNTNLPWSFKIFYGIICDSVAICGSSKRAYVVLMGLFQTVALLIVPLFPGMSAVDVMWVTTVYSIGGAFMEVVCQGMMVVECRKDPKYGSEDLQTFAWCMYGIGGTFACFMQGWLCTKWPDGKGALICYLITGIFTGILGVAGFFLDKDLEENQSDMNQMGLWQRTKFVFKEVAEGLKIKELYTVLIYQLILGSIVPQFSTYLYYYQINISNFTAFQYSMLQLIGNITMIPGALLYNMYLKESEFSFLMIVACIVNCTGSVLTMLFCLGYDLGVPYIYTMFTTTVTDVLYMMFINMAPSVLFAKLIPEKIESSMYAFSTGLMNLTGLNLAPDLGILINMLFVHVNFNDLQKTWELFAIQAGCSLLPLLFLWILPKRNDITKVQNCLTYIRINNKPRDEIEIEDLYEAYEILDAPHMKVLKITQEPEGYQEWLNKKNKEGDYELKSSQDEPTLMGTIDDVQP